MAYASWSVVFGEQPSAAKWNILGTNDAYFNAQIGSSFSSTSSTVWMEELGRTTLGSAGDTITVSSLTARKYLRLFIYAPTSGSTDILLRFNNDSGSNYASRYSTNGAADTTSTSASSVVLAIAETSDKFSVVDVDNVSAKEKLLAGQSLSFGTAGAANAPTKWENAGKWSNTSAQITRVDVINDQAGDFATGSEVVVLGHD